MVNRYYRSVKAVNVSQDVSELEETLKYIKRMDKNIFNILHALERAGDEKSMELLQIVSNEAGKTLQPKWDVIKAIEAIIGLF